MAGNGLPTLGRVKLTDLITTEGLPSDTYKLSVSTLSQSLAQYSAAIIQLPPPDAALLRCCLESSRPYFNQKPPYPSSDMIHIDDSREWCKTSGYTADPQLWQESYDYRPGLTSTDHNSDIELPPSGLGDVFIILGKAARDILDAISFYLNLRSCAFTEILDNVPLRNREVSSSLLSVGCHARPSFQMSGHLCEELIVEIFTRLPPKTLLRFRSLSKSLFSHISSPIFIRMQTFRSPQKMIFKHIEDVDKKTKAVCTLHGEDELSLCLGHQREYVGLRRTIPFPDKHYKTL